MDTSAGGRGLRVGAAVGKDLVCVRPGTGRARRLNRCVALKTSPGTERTSTRGARVTISLPHACATLARSVILKPLVVAHARDSTLIAPPSCFSCVLLSGFSGACFSRAHPTHVPLGTAHRRENVWASVRARVRAVRSTGLIFFLSAGVGLRVASCPRTSPRLHT